MMAVRGGNASITRGSIDAFLFLHCSPVRLRIPHLVETVVDTWSGVCCSE